MSKTWSGIGGGSCFLRSWASECAPQPWLMRDHPAVVVGELVGADPEHRRPADLRAAPGSHSRRSVRAPTGRAATSGPWSPSYQRCAARSRPSSREHPRAAEAELVDDVGLVVVGALPGEVRRHQPRVVLVGGKQVTRGEVTRLDAVAPRDPLGRGDRLVAGQQHDLVDRHRVLAGGVRDGDGPDPAGVARLPAREVVGDRGLDLGPGGEVLTDDVGAHLLRRARRGQRRRPRGRRSRVWRSRSGFSLIGMGRVCPGPSCWQDVNMEEETAQREDTAPTAGRAQSPCRGRDRPRDQAGRLGDGPRRVVHLPPGAPGLPRRGRRRLRPLPADRAARLQRRR